MMPVFGGFFPKNFLGTRNKFQWLKLGKAPRSNKKSKQKFKEEYDQVETNLCNQLPVTISEFVYIANML
jgi:hypothetical protein